MATVCDSREQISNLGNYTLLGSSVFTTAAAFASWASVAQHRQDAQERRQPNLLGAVTQLKGPNVGEKTPTSFNILNTGGTAMNVSCVLAIEKYYFANPVGPGFLRHQQEAGLRTEMPPSPNQRALLMCRDLKQQVWVWDLNMNVRKYDGRKTDPASDFEAFWLDFYGEKLSLLTRIGSEVAIEVMTVGGRHVSNPSTKRRQEKLINGYEWCRSRWTDLMRSAAHQQEPPQLALRSRAAVRFVHCCAPLRSQSLRKSPKPRE